MSMHMCTLMFAHLLAALTSLAHACNGLSVELTQHFLVLGITAWCPKLLRYGDPLCMAHMRDVSLTRPQTHAQNE